jgi:hypothetical protein
MPFDGSGNYNLPGPALVDGQTVSATEHNTFRNDIAAAMDITVTRDGQSPATNNLPMGGFKHTNVADGTALTDYASIKQLQTRATNFLTSVSGTNTITGLASPAPSSYQAGQEFNFLSTGANTGAVTLNINSLGAISIKKSGNVDLISNDIPNAGALIKVVYDGTNFQLVSLYLTDFSVTTAKIADNAVTTAKIADNAVTTAKIADNAVTTAKILDNNVTAAKLANDAKPNNLQSITVASSSNTLVGTYNSGMLGFRSTTLGTGTPTVLNVGSIAITIPAGATLGAANGIAARFIYAVANNGGTPVLCVANISGGLQMDETNLISPTTISAGATSAATWYSASSVAANSAYRIVGFADNTQATAGTYAAQPSLVQGVGGQAFAGMSSFGYGQTRQDLTGSRSLSTTYYNTTGKPIFVEMSSVSSSTITVTVQGVAVAMLATNVAFPVGPFESYSIASTNPLQKWVERR